MLVLRFANGIFEPIWNRQFIDHVQITVAESLGVEGRGEFYEQAGAIRDVVQNHMLQLVALTAMEPPIDFEADAVRNEKVKVLRAMHTPGPEARRPRPVRPGLHRGRARCPATARSPASRPDSETETFVAAKLYVDNWRWADTPFYIRTGKRLPRRETTIAIQFKRAPHPPFEVDDEEGLRPNVLLIHIQPDEGVSLAIGAKVPGQGVSIRTVHMDFLYGGAFRVGLPEAYERLILDCLLGDATLFTRADEVEEQWAIVDAMRRALEARPAALPQLRGRDVGPARGRRAPAPRRPLLEAALAWARRTSAGARARARRSCATPRPSRARRRACGRQRHDPHRLGAGALGRGGHRDARGPRRAPPLAHDPALPEAGRSSATRSRARSTSAASSAAASSARSARRSSRCASAARAPRRRPASSMPLLVSDLPVVPALARAAALRRAPSWSSSSASPTGSSSTRASGPTPSATARGFRSSSTGSPSPTSPGRERSAGGQPSPISGRTSRRRRTIRVAGPEDRGGASRALARLAARARRRARSTSRPERSSWSRSTGTTATRLRAEVGTSQRPALRPARGLQPRPDLRGGRTELLVVADLAEPAPSWIAERAGRRSPFRIALTGGSAPGPVYERLAELPLDWSSWHVWWSDERAVPADHPDSNEKPRPRGAPLPRPHPRGADPSAALAGAGAAGALRPRPARHRPRRAHGLALPRPRGGARPIRARSSTSPSPAARRYASADHLLAAAT